MELHWKDKYDDLGKWAYLDVQVKSSNKPTVLLKSGASKQPPPKVVALTNPLKEGCLTWWF